MRWVDARAGIEDDSGLGRLLGWLEDVARISPVDCHPLVVLNSVDTRRCPLEGQREVDQSDGDDDDHCDNDPDE